MKTPQPPNLSAAAGKNSAAAEFFPPFSAASLPADF
jgi:hypothetical protein